MQGPPSHPLVRHQEAVWQLHHVRDPGVEHLPGLRGPRGRGQPEELLPRNSRLFFYRYFYLRSGHEGKIELSKIYTFCWDHSLTTWPLMSFNAKSNSETVNFHVQNIKVLCFTFRKLKVALLTVAILASALSHLASEYIITFYIGFMPTVQDKMNRKVVSHFTNMNNTQPSFDCHLHPPHTIPH